jgi:polysaccharide export outer membrane protein
MYKKRAWPAVGLFLVVVLGGCAASAQTGQTSPAVPPAAAAAQPAQGVQLTPGYRIGPGDSLQIFVWDHADLTTSVQVRPDGRITSPLVEDLQAAGKEPTALARDIEKVLAEYVRSPVVTVIVQEFVGETAQQVRVVGQAVQPRALQYKTGMTVLDVIIEVGGLSEFAAGNRARIVRRVDGREVEIRVKLDDILKGKIEQNKEMLPGDVLIIPQSVL